MTKRTQNLFNAIDKVVELGKGKSEAELMNICIEVAKEYSEENQEVFPKTIFTYAIEEINW